MSFTFTVFTPTYNRAHTLHRVYDSLKAQTFRDFEWLVVDDGSADDTKALIDKWQKDADFPIRYVTQDHLGRHVALNRGADESRGKFFFPVSSDDGLAPNALERFKFYWDDIPDAEKPRFCGVKGLSRDPEGNIVGDKYPRDVLDSDDAELYYRHKVRRGDHCGFYRTDVVRRIRFPELKNLAFVVESNVLFTIAKEFKMRYVNEPLYIYYPDENPGSNRLSEQLKTYRPDLMRVCALGHQFNLNECLGWFSSAPFLFLQSGAYYSRFSFHAGTGLREQSRGLTKPLGKLLWGIFIPLGFIIYCRDKIVVSKSGR